MIRVSVLYPNAAGTKFDMAYYRNKHIPMVKQLLGIACKRIDVDHGLAGAQPELSATFAAMAHLTFDSV
ncbi:EthD family reductase, partial [Aromatoleum bremense]|uniref:EthD family reductase n=1 Tax=Aromatoleum bremense TaxID=76115 RepID=UPI00145F5022